MRKESLLYNTSIIAVLFLGLYFMIKIFVLGNAFEDDECRLALAIMDKNLLQMFLPVGPLSSTPVFLFVSKIIAELTNYNEHALKFLPLVFSIANLFLFYKICENYFQRKISVVLCLYLFAVNLRLLYFSSIFKTYSLEVLICLLCLYYFPKIKLDKLSNKQLLLITISIAVLPLISLPSLFCILPFFLINLYKGLKNKMIIKRLLCTIAVFLIVFSIYYFVNLLPTKNLQMLSYSHYWTKVFSVPIYAIFPLIIKCLLYPNNLILSPFLMVCFSLIYVIIQKKEHVDFNIYIFSTFFLIILVSYFKLYPATIGRTSLFIMPALLIAMVKPLDVLNYKKITFYITCFIFLLGIYIYFLPPYLISINNVYVALRNYAPDTLILEMSSRYNKDTDEVVLTEPSFYSYKFYSIKHNLNFKNILVPAKLGAKEEFYYNFFNNLNPNKNYWFYMIKEYAMTPQRIYPLKWLQNQNVIYQKKDKDSYLYYISGIRKNKTTNTNN